MATTFDEDQNENEGTSGWSMPSYMSGAANHSTGNLNSSWSDELSTLDKIGYFASSAAISGINGFYNTGVWAGNLFSSEEAVYRDTREYVASFDEDMGKYYEENRQAADLVGFLVSSFIPGLGGVKVLNAGTKALAMANEGRAGINMANALGILPGSREALVRTAVAEAATTSRAYSIANAATARAVGAGFGEQAIQALAFETAVAATMHKNPILSDMDTGDLIKNIFVGAALGGAIGGSINAATTIFKVKGAIKNVDELTSDVTQIRTGVAGTSASDDFLIVRNDLEHTRINAKDGVDQSHWDELVERKYQQADNIMRGKVTQLAGGDSALGNLIYDGIANDSSAAITAKMLGLAEIAPLSKMGQLTKKYDLNKVVDDLNPDDTLTHGVRYLRSWGDDMGKLSDDVPTPYLTDSLAPGQSIKFTARGINVGGNESYSVKLGEYWAPSLQHSREAMARNQWAYAPEVPALSVPKGDTLLSVGEFDIPVLTKAYREGFTDVRLLDEAGEVVGEITTPKQLLETIKSAKVRLTDQMSDAMLTKGKLPEESIDSIAYVTDTPVGFITGGQVAENTEDAIFYLRNAQRSYYNKVHANTTNPPDIDSVTPWTRPQNYAMVYDLERVNGVDNFGVEAMVQIVQRQKLQTSTNEFAVANAMGSDAALLPSMQDRVVKEFDRTGAGPGFMSYANGGYGSAQSFFEFVGKWTQGQKLKATDKISNTFNNIAQSLKEAPESVTRLATIIQQVRNSGEHYVLNDTGSGLLLRKIRDRELAIANGREAADISIPPGVKEEILFNDPLVAEFAATHIATNSSRLSKQNAMRHSQGMYDDFDPNTFYPPQPNPDRFKFHAFVVDDSKVISDYNSTMLYANDAGNLEKQIAEARRQGFSVYTKAETADYYKARGQYEYSKGLNENQIDSRLSRGGTSAPAFPLTGRPEEIVDDLLLWHIKKEQGMVREAVELKYSNEFGILRRMGEQYTQVATSTRTPSIFSSKVVKNPFQEYIDLALDKPLNDKYPLWNTINQSVSAASDRVWSAVGRVWKDAKSPYDLEQTNKILGEYGLNVAATEAQLQAWTNHPAGSNALQKFIRSQNSMLSTLVLRLDPINALNNAVGSNVLLGAETAAVTRAIQAGDARAVGELAELTKIQLPGTDDAIAAPSKLIANAYKNFFTNHDELVKKYEGLGVDVNLAKQFKMMVDDLTLDGTETAAQMDSKLKQAFTKLKGMGDAGEKWTGNRFAESMNRYVTANVMDQITSVAVRAGVMDQKTANTYINTFLNRVQGNLVANQRPQIFTGPVGQAIGLFQSYQFNIMQQLLRHVGEGHTKDALTLLGLQGAIYGMNGLPAFQAINTHIIGNASGNVNHTDAYSSIYNAAGKSAGDWLTYGLASNFFIHPDLKINLYSRGDINPRSITVVPTNLAEIPIASAYARFFGGMKDTMSNVGMGGDLWNSFLGGVEQSSVNRPLAGLARVVRGAETGVVFSQSGQGNIVAANDLYSLANLARLSGAKPFDEAVTQDAVFRVQAYSRADTEKRTKLGKAIRTVITGGGTPTAEQMETFQENYVKIGGKQEEFTKWYMNQLKAASTSQANKIVENQKKSQYSQYMSAITGGRVFNTPSDIMRENASLSEEE